jgi:HEAT repeat protein
MSDQQPIERLIKALWDENEAVRAQAIEALGEIGEPALPALLRALRDDDRNYETRTFKATPRVR